jgi:four helix bundle protein
MDLDDWVAKAPEAIRESPTWRVRAYQIGAFSAVCAADDAAGLERKRRFVHLAPQLLRSAASIAANVAEGYPRRSRRDRIRYYEYALGSAREAATWYLIASGSLERTAFNARMAHLTRVSQLLVKMITNERLGTGRSFPDPPP